MADIELMPHGEDDRRPFVLSVRAPGLRVPLGNQLRGSCLRTMISFFLRYYQPYDSFGTKIFS